MVYDLELYFVFLLKEFLDTLDDVVPEVRKSLQGELLPMYLDLLSLNTYYPVSLSDWETLRGQTTIQEITGFCNCVERWAENWKLTADWCKAAALTTLQIWSSSGNPASGFWHSLTKMMPRHPPPDGLPSYQYEFGRDKYLEIIKESARQNILDHPILKYGEPSRRNEFIESIASDNRVIQYCDQVERDFKRFSPPERRSLSRHLIWTARYHIKGDKQVDIATEEDVEPAAVSSAIKRVLIDLQLRS